MDILLSFCELTMHVCGFKSGQIPAFGDWEHANELPITQYFESARQAGLIRYSSSGECDQYMHSDLYSTDFKKPSRDLGPQRKVRRSLEPIRIRSSFDVKFSSCRVPTSLMMLKAIMMLLMMIWNGMHGWLMVHRRQG